MAKLKLRISELRRTKGISQQELADELKVSYQSVSKWETGSSMPDISLLPEISRYFDVSVDELLGLVPLKHTNYISRNTDDRNSWNENSETVHSGRRYFWNDDYLKFLIDHVWEVKTAVNIVDFRCGDGYLGMKLMSVLPKGSTYTGVDSPHFLNETAVTFQASEFDFELIPSDIYSFNIENKFDLAICQAGLRHMNKPLEILERMKGAVKSNGLIVCVEVNREFENDGFFLNGMDYEYLCSGFDFHELWRKEFENEGRDYAIGMKLPHYFKKIELGNIDVRMNDKALFITPDMKDYDKNLKDFVRINGWNRSFDDTDKERIIEMFMSRGYDRYRAETYFTRHESLVRYFKDNGENISLTKVNGLMIVSGRK